MADKNRERWYLDRLIACYPNFPSGSIVSGETPDLIVQSEECTTGIEITQFHVPPQEGARPVQELQSLKEQVVNAAHRIHTESGEPALYVVVNYRTPLTLAKRDIQRVAKELALAIRSTPVPETIHAPFINVAWNDLPDTIASVHIHGSVDGQVQLWDVDSEGWIAPVEASLVNDVIERKTQMAQIARNKCDHLWLVIVNDEFSLAAPAELKYGAMLSVERGPFERVIWFSPNSGTFYETS